MTITVGVKEAQRRMHELIDAAVDGQDVIITRYKVPVARLQAATAEERSRWLAEQVLEVTCG
jgi:prevent-host-death family protein